MRLKAEFLAILLLLSGTAQASELTFAVIGDYGDGGRRESRVATLVRSWSPDVVLTLGDNNYPSGAAGTLDRHVGRDYHSFIAPYRGRYGLGAQANQFFPTLGNHDWMEKNIDAHLRYFTLPGNGRYYDFVRGPVHFFALDSDGREPDGNTADSTQGRWLRDRLAASTAPFKVVYFHHPPYSSSNKHGSSRWMQWPFRAWGADVVLAGHDHTYERIVSPEDGMHYIVNGLGGAKAYGFGPPVRGSLKRFNADVGALRVVADERLMTFSFITQRGKVIDEFVLRGRTHSP